MTVPLFRVWNENRDMPWQKLLDFWGLPNLQVINRDAHAAKCAIEARHRRVARSLETELRVWPQADIEMATRSPLDTSNNSLLTGLGLICHKTWRHFSRKAVDLKRLPTEGKDCAS
jgi:hypothetical protein